MIHKIRSLAVCLTILALPVPAQVSSASLTGLVSDPSGAVVAGARVTARGSATNLERSAATDSAGYYYFASLPIGQYEISVEASGFAKAAQTVTLETAQRGRQDFTLSVGQVQNVVNVEATAPQLSAEDANIGSVVDNNYVNHFPLFLRSWDDLVNVVAGVQGSRYTEQSGATSAGRTGGFNVHGVRQLQNNFILDGVDNNSISENVQELSTQVVRPSVDALQEFRVLTNPYSAEYGRSPGAAIIVTTKGGTNNYHGVAYEYLRNRVFDANDFFSNRSGLVKPQNVQNQFGGNVGGPIVKDRLFWFFDYEGTRVRKGVSRVATVPLANERIGDFSPATAASLGLKPYAAIHDPTTGQPFPDNRIPQERLDPYMQKIMALFPAPNQPGALNNFARNAGLSDSVDRLDGRGDWTADEKDNLFVRYSYSNRSRFIPGYFGGLADGTSTSAWGRQILKAHAVALGWNRILGARAVNEFRAGFGRDYSFAQQDPFGRNKVSDYVPGVPDNPSVAGGISRITFAGLPTFIGSPDFLPKQQVTQQWQFIDTLSLNRGRHSIKAGADIRAPMRNNFLDVPGTRGTLGFDRIFTCQRNAAGQCVSGTGFSYADALLGYVQSAQLSNVYFVDQRLHMLGFFAEDAFKITPKLTLNLGLRYDFATPPLEAKNHISNFDPAGSGALVQAKSGSIQDRATIKPDYNNWAPRVGFAWQLNNRTVLRSGYGFFYQLFERYGSEDQLALNAPFLINNTPAVPSTATAPLFLLQNGFPAGFLDPANLNLKLVRVRAIDPSIRAPSVQQWSFGLQRTLPWNLFVEADYVGTKSTHLTQLTDFNQPINGVKPYPNFGYIEYKMGGGNGAYNGLDFTLERRFQAGLTFRLAYTFSKSIDNAAEPLTSNSGSAQNGRDYSKWRGPSDFDIRQRVVVSYVYDLPFGKGHALASTGPLSWIVGGWRTSGSYTFASGRPFTVTSGGSLSNTIDPYGANTAIPFVIGTPVLPQDVNCWYYSSKNNACKALAPDAQDAFQLQQAGQFGNAGRNILRAPGTSVFDINLQRDFPITERAKLTFRAEAFNLFNTTQFGRPSTDFSSAAAGTITTLASDPRAMQFALRLAF